MPRPPRAPEPGGIYHITSRGNRRQEIYRVADDNRRFLALAATLIRKRSWRVWAYCLMPNHYHLLATTPAGDLSEGMHWLNGLYARWFNETHGLDGHLFQGRFHAVHVDRGEHLLEAIRYLVLNPVRARLCGSPGDWPWSNYRALAGIDPTPRGLDQGPALSLFGREPEAARAAFRSFVADGRLRTGSR